MCSTLIYKVRIWQKTLPALFHQRSSAFFMLKTEGKSSQLPLPARFLWTRDSDSHPGDRKTDSNKQTRVKNATIGGRETESWYDAVPGSPLRKKSPILRSVFASGTAKRTNELMKKKERKRPTPQDAQDEETTSSRPEVPPPDRPLSVAEWRNLKESLGQNDPRFESRMMVTMAISGAELDIAKSLLTFVATETGTLSYKMLVQYLTFCVYGGHDAEVFDIYEIFRGNFPSLDTGAFSLFIRSFSRTARWREVLRIMDEFKKVIIPSRRNYHDIISAAVLHGDMTTAWAVYDELIEKGHNPQHDTWETLFKGGTGTDEEKEKEAEVMSQSEYQERLLSVLLHMRNNQIYPKYSLARSIKTWFESLTGQNWTGSWTTVSPKGVCRCCGSELESILLTAEEYQQLKDRVMTNVIEGRDVYTKTTPEELAKFKMFVKNKPPFDVVIDGLNVAMSTKDKRNMSAILLTVVSELHRQGRTILVLGREHMLQSSRSRWDRHHMKLIQQMAHCFFTGNQSLDDPFLLYSALHSGSHCQFVSRDLMRDHKASLPDEATRRLFFKWQRGHQLVMPGPPSEDGRFKFLRIHSYDTIVQTSATSWHIPFDDTEDRASCEVPVRWLCLSKKA